MLGRRALLEQHKIFEVLLILAVSRVKPVPLLPREASLQYGSVSRH